MNDESSHVDENDENTHPSQDATIKPSSFASSSSPSSSSSSILVADDSSMMMLLEEENADTPSPAAAVAAPENRDVSSSVMVAVRVRPLLAMEDGTDHCLRVLQNNTALQIGSSSSSAAADHEDGPQFTFDRVFDSNASQLDIFEQCVTPLVQQCIQGYNATIFAYGQTGSGKTYTIMGESTTDGRAGILPRAVQALFAALDLEKSTVKIQFLEVYGEEIRDLLTNNHGTKLSIRDVGQDTEPEVLNATQKQVSSDQEALRALTHGMLRRVTGGTAMNQASSRSHAILSIMIEQQQTICGVGGGATNNADGTSNDTSMCGDGDDSNGMEQHVQIKRSKFNFVDLAGSERQKRTQAEGKRLKEGIDINKGLLVLGNVISALGDPKKRGKTHVPYRDSKLTRLLKGSLGGNHKTLMIACVSPSSINMDESLNCLRYANRAKNIQNHAVVNVDASSKLVQELQTQVQVLAAEVLRVYESPDTTTTKQVFSKQELQALASGEALGSGALLSSSSSVPNKLVSATSYHHDESQKLRDLELELDRTREQLQESRSHHDTAEEQLYVSKAENELYKLQLSVISKDGSVPVLTEQQAFLESAKAYEAEIGKLRAALQEAESKANRMAWATTDDEQEQQALQKAKQTLEDERRRLASMQASLNVVDGVGNSLEPSPQQPPSNESIMDREEQEEQAKLQNLTEKYLSEHDSYEDKSEHDEARNDEPDEEAAPESSDASGQRQRHLEINLNELSRSIAAKEDLIEQLRLSHEKFAVRTLYTDIAWRV
jgi:kinesin family protein 4/21/27